LTACAAKPTGCAPKWSSAPPARGPTGCANSKAHAPKLRPLRGSHLVFPAWRLPVAQAVSLMHPMDGRPVFTFPWEGATLVGTTDVDHRGDMQMDAAHHAPPRWIT
jgi:glycerol-3-phosphate dehydrogenase